MQDYLRQHDIVYNTPLEDWPNGLPIGNGDLGAICYAQGKYPPTANPNFWYLDDTKPWNADYHTNVNIEMPRLKIPKVQRRTNPRLYLGPKYLAQVQDNRCWLVQLGN